LALDPGLDGLLTAMAQAGLKGLAQADDPATARNGFRAMTWELRPASMVIGVGEVSDGQIAGPAGPLRTRTYRPEGTSGTVPTVLFLHGGGFVIGDLDTHDNQARRLCREVGAVVVSLDYRLAPEDPFPAAIDDAWAGLLWTAAHLDELGGSGSALAVAGDSAGGNLAAVVARRARDAGGPALAAQLLIYPAVDFTAEVYADPPVYPSRLENREGKLLTLDDLAWFGSQYVGTADGVDLADPDLSPLHAADLSGLAPAIVITAEYDPLRDEGEAYAQALQAAGTPVTLERMDGMIHGFFDLGPASPAVEAAVVRTCDLLRAALT
jgi:acetyl esterase